VFHTVLFSNVQQINLLGTHVFKDLKIPTANDRWFTGGRRNNSYVSIARPSTSKSLQDLASMNSSAPPTRTAVLVAWAFSSQAFNCTIVFFSSQASGKFNATVT